MKRTFPKWPKWMPKNPISKIHKGPTKEKQPTTEEIVEGLCPKCGGIVILDRFDTKSYGPESWNYSEWSVYKCKSCGKEFTRHDELLELEGKQP